MAGNWKMYKTASETTAFFEKFAPLVDKSDHADVVICPTFVNLPAAVAATTGTRIEIGGQNLFWKNEGAFTGEISGPMLKAVGAKWVIIGHSERRQYFGETDETVLKRTVAALEAGLNPIVCVGERLEERDSGATETVLKTQFDGGLAGLPPEQFAKVVIAYEPVWAIGTGEVAGPAEILAAHAFVREKLVALLPNEGAAVRILYGGSVKPDNAGDIIRLDNVDGVLVGGASLKADSFSQIVLA